MNNEINYIPIIFKYIKNNTNNIIYTNNIEKYNFKNMITNDIIFYILYISILLFNNKNNNKKKNIINNNIINNNIVNALVKINIIHDLIRYRHCY